MLKKPYSLYCDGKLERSFVGSRTHKLTIQDVVGACYKNGHWQLVDDELNLQIWAEIKQPGSCIKLNCVGF